MSLVWSPSRRQERTWTCLRCEAEYSPEKPEVVRCKICGEDNCPNCEARACYCCGDAVCTEHMGTWKGHSNPYGEHWCLPCLQVRAQDIQQEKSELCKEMNEVDRLIWNLKRETAKFAAKKTE